MARIARLSQHLVNKIAAGEVVERPASVLKELLENSLDAGATRIDVEVEDGGKKLIRISDNGCGMDGEDLLLAFAPHATSKIARDEDLFTIETLGFRGEALASIASISQVEIVSRSAEAIEAARLEIAGGECQGPAPAAGAAGTTISVRNLFFNTPARRKFLRTTNTELGHVSEQFTRIALAHRSVQLNFAHNGRTLHQLSAGQSLAERIGTLFSAELADGLIAIERCDRGVEVSGLIGRPQHSRSGAQWQYVFLNGRHIRDRFVSHAIREAYRGLLEVNRQPVAFLFLKMAPEAVDVNVHPSKVEVRFADSNMVHSQVLAAIRDRLLSTDLSVPMTTSSGGALASGTPEVVGKTEGEETPEERQKRVRQAMVDFFETVPARANQDRAFATPTATSVYPSDKHGFTAPSGAPAAEKTVDMQSSIPSEMQTAAFVREFTAPSAQGEAPGGVGFIQIHNAYLVVQSDDGLMIIDQHALHERILYEELNCQLNAGPLVSQRFLIPEIIEVTAAQMAVVENERELLGKLGIIVEPFGPRTIAVQGFPMLLKKLPAEGFVADLLDTLTAKAGQVSREELLHKVLDMMACKAAVKAGDALSKAEIENLLRQRELVSRGSNCPHGRPTTISLSLSDLDKQFKRT